MNKKVFVEVAPAIPLSANARQTFTYQSEENIQLYSIVDVSFGRQNIQGIVLKIHNHKPPYPTKSIRKAANVQLTEQQVEFAAWIANACRGGLGFTLRLCIPPASKKGNEEKIHTKKNIKTKKSAYIEKNNDKRRHAIYRMTHLNKKQSLIIVPEKWMLNTFEKEFHKEIKTSQAAIFHGGLTPAQTTRIWHQVQSNKTRIIIGTQKAFFLPFQNLALIILEEEQLTSHKLWDQYPRLHNKIAVEQLAHVHKSNIVYTSSFPSLETHHAVQSKKMVITKNNPTILRNSIIPLSFEDKKMSRMLPEELIIKLKQWRKKHERILLFYNQRGGWKAAMCRKCKKTVTCTICNTSMNIQTNKKALTCSQCKNKQQIPKICPKCKKGSLRYIGFGTEIVEHVLEKFPSFKKGLIRIDAQTKKRINKKHHIILGTSALFTQMHETKFDRVVWLFPERNMFYPDFRNYEHTLNIHARLQQHTKQRRAVTIATNNQQLIEEEITANINTLVKQQLKERKQLNYPPYTKMVKLTITERSAKKAMEKAEHIRKTLEKRIKNKEEFSSIIIRGPFQGFDSYRKGKSQSHLITLGKLEHLIQLYSKTKIDAADIMPHQVL